MWAQQQARRKILNGNHLKNVFGSNSHNTLISTLDKKRSDISKDKVKNNQLVDFGDHIDTKGSAVINFRQIKKDQNVQQTQRINKDFHHLKINKKNTVLEPQNHAQNTLNTRNMLLNKPKKPIADIYSERSVSHKKKSEDKNIKKPAKKVAKVATNMTSTNEVDDFECDEELEFKAERKTQKKLLTQPSIQKQVVNDKHSFTTMKGKIPDFDPLKEMKDFEAKQQQVNLLAQSQLIACVEAKQFGYEIDPCYIEKKQKHLNWTMRAILMDWMMHISYQFRLKRQTLHTALIIVDKYFQSTSNLAKADFQLAGATSLFIAAKLQQFQPLSSKQFAKSTRDRYTAEEIKSCETKMCKALKFQLNPPTLNMWANKIMQQWDLYLETTDILHHPFFLYHKAKYFKKIDDSSYKLFRQVMQILDCAILDIQTVQYKPKVLVCSLLYLILGKQFEQFSKKQIINDFPRSSMFCIQNTPFKDLFEFFIQQSFNLQMCELLPSAQYIATYFILPLNYDTPCLRPEDDEAETMHLEEYCSYQTYNPNMLAAVKKRFRGIYQ